MTLFTWIAEFYPEPADVPTNDADRCRHSIRKWEGARKENLKRHGMVHRIGYAKLFSDELFSDGPSFWFGPDTCALCLVHMEEEDCNKSCPLLRAGFVPCGTSPWLDESVTIGSDPYEIWCDTGDPEPMIAALKKALEMVEGRG